MHFSQLPLLARDTNKDQCDSMVQQAALTWPPFPRDQSTALAKQLALAYYHMEGETFSPRAHLVVAQQQNVAVLLLVLLHVKHL